jgi:hypothetical protein
VLKRSDTSVSSVVIDTLKEFEMLDSVISEFSFNESGDILGPGHALDQVMRSTRSVPLRLASSLSRLIDSNGKILQTNSRL